MHEPRKLTTDELLAMKDDDEARAAHRESVALYAAEKIAGVIATRPDIVALDDFISQIGHDLYESLNVDAWYGREPDDTSRPYRISSLDYLSHAIGDKTREMVDQYVATYDIAPFVRDAISLWEKWWSERGANIPPCFLMAGNRRYEILRNVPRLIEWRVRDEIASFVERRNEEWLDEQAMGNPVKRCLLLLQQTALSLRQSADDQSDPYVGGVDSSEIDILDEQIAALAAILGITLPEVIYE